MCVRSRPLRLLLGEDEGRRAVRHLGCSAEDARGASAIVNALRAVRMLAPMTEEEAHLCGIDDEPERYFRVVPAKTNLAKRTGRHVWRELVSVSLGNDFGEGMADQMGAVRRWDPPAFADEEQMERIKKALSGGQYRLDVRADNWAGKPIAQILRLDLREPHTRVKIRRAIRSWVEKGELRVEERVDEHRVRKQFIWTTQSIGETEQVSKPVPQPGPASALRDVRD